MSDVKPEKAFILAAGMGTRMRPLTNDIPKPMIKVGGKTMVDHALDSLLAEGVKCCMVNTHYKADILHAHLKQRSAPEIKISHEPELLDTGGGIQNAIENFDGDEGRDFFVLSGDSVWEDKPDAPMLKKLSEIWDAAKMDILIALQPVESMVLTRGVGDYDLDDQGRAVRNKEKKGRYMFTSVRINSAQIFDSAPAAGQAFSYLALLDKAEEKGRLYGYVHTGKWHHISTPHDVRAVDAAWGAGLK